MKLPKKRKIILVAVVLVLLILAAVIAAVLQPKKEYRSISVEAVQGSVIVVNEKNNNQAYKGQRLYGGDDVTVNENSELTMCMNNDKYLYADESTHFRLEDRSTKNSSRIRIILDKGSELNELTEKLGTDESYEVDTPNSTMSVRGTKFRVTVFTDSDGLVYTLLEVEEGVVFVQLKTITGTFNGVEKEFYKDQSALIAADENFSEFVKTEKGEEVWVIDYSTLPEEPLPRLKALIEMAGYNKEDSEGGKTPGNSEEKPTKEPIKPTELPVTPTEGQASPAAGTVSPTAGQASPTKEPAKPTKAAEATTAPKATTKPTAKPTQAEPGITEAADCKTLGHDFSSWTTQTAATCSTTGTETRKCTRCGETESRTISKKSHSWGEWNTVEKPTCEKSGLEKRSCTVCGEAETKAISATGNHSYSSWTTVKAATCKEKGTESHKCSVCGKTETRSTELADHNWSRYKTVKEPTCVDAGSEERSCLVCGKKENRTISATGNHSWDNYVEDLPAICGRDGEYHYTCSVCGAESEHETIPKLTHDYKVYSQENIDSEKYKVTYRCKYCGSEYSVTKMGQV